MIVSIVVFTAVSITRRMAICKAGAPNCQLCDEELKQLPESFRFRVQILKCLAVLREPKDCQSVNVLISQILQPLHSMQKQMFGKSHINKSLQIRAIRYNLWTPEVEAVDLLYLWPHNMHTMTFTWKMNSHILKKHCKLVSSCKLTTLLLEIIRIFWQQSRHILFDLKWYFESIRKL